MHENSVITFMEVFQSSKNLLHNPNTCFGGLHFHLQHKSTNIPTPTLPQNNNQHYNIVKLENFTLKQATKQFTVQTNAFKRFKKCSILKKALKFLLQGQNFLCLLIQLQILLQNIPSITNQTQNVLKSTNQNQIPPSFLVIKSSSIAKVRYRQKFSGISTIYDIFYCQLYELKFLDRVKKYKSHNSNSDISKFSSFHQKNSN
eukprot:TRINITY_DN19598_c1_g1_i1.p1 TRINITY_DN19598_c1_g1~~TRINITY_DN19598_c1_g1_i1.p1  ORF type:complete len:202 (-),score=-3.61 TRINITY_DN19598_c1_g1_i1:824-1429(-)